MSRRTVIAVHNYLFHCCRLRDTGPFLASRRTLVMAVNVRPRGRVLVVDDDPVIYDLVGPTLTEHGYTTRRALDAREALYLIERETPDVVLLDVRLPDISRSEEHTSELQSQSN